MNVTFFVGNGFDLNLGLKTQYKDVYEKYVLEPSSSDTIATFKKDLCANYENWADFEMGMAEYASRVLTEEQLIECVRDFRNYLLDYLDNEQKEWANLLKGTDLLQEYGNEIYRSYRDFYYDLIPNERTYIERYLSDPYRPEKNYYTVSLNYTTLLDFFIEHIPKNKDKGIYYSVLHPHGKGVDGIALGVDNEFQLDLHLSRKGKRAFVKPFFIQDYDSKRMDEALDVIEKSDIICIYGLSLGDSDKTWRDTLSEWLEDHPRGRIVWYAYDIANINEKNKDEVLDEEERLKHIFLSKLGLDERFDEYEKQICIPVKKSIFKFLSREDILKNRLNKSKELIAK